MVTKQELQSIDPYEFEELIAELWESKGYTTTVRSKSNDRGIDIEAERGGFKEVIQAKRYNETNKIGSKEVRTYATLYQQTDANQVVLVTSGQVVESAKELADDLHVDIFDGEDLCRELGEESIGIINSDDTDSAHSQSIDNEYPNRLNVQYQGSCREYQTTNNKILTHEKHIEILCTCFGKGISERISTDDDPLPTQFLNYFSDYCTDSSLCVQIGGNNYSFNQLTEEEYELIKSYTQRPEFEAVVDDGPNNSEKEEYMICILQKIRPTPQHMAEVCEDFLNELYDIGLENINAIEARSNNEEPDKAWEWLETSRR